MKLTMLSKYNGYGKNKTKKTNINVNLDSVRRKKYNI